MMLTSHLRCWRCNTGYPARLIACPTCNPLAPPDGARVLERKPDDENPLDRWARGLLVPAPDQTHADRYVRSVLDEVPLPHEAPARKLSVARARRVDLGMEWPSPHEPPRIDTPKHDYVLGASHGIASLACESFRLDTNESGRIVGLLLQTEMRVSVLDVKIGCYSLFGGTRENLTVLPDFPVMLRLQSQIDASPSVPPVIVAKSIDRAWGSLHCTAFLRRVSKRECQCGAGPGPCAACDSAWR